MKRLFLLVALLIAGLAAPALAQTPRAVVRGARPLYVAPPPPVDYGFDYSYYDSPQYIYGDPLDRYYDPAGKVPDDRYYGPPAVDMVLATTLTRNHESILSHILHCQAAYPTYNAATNFYSGRDGIPRVCYR